MESNFKAARHPICTSFRSSKLDVSNRGVLMAPLSRFQALTNRRVQIQEKTEGLRSDLQKLIQLLDSNIETEEERTGVFDLTNSNYSVMARRLRTRRDKLAAAVSKLMRSALLH
jgi:hypothetical protein